jgi:hypothetical protein
LLVDIEVCVEGWIMEEKPTVALALAFKSWAPGAKTMQTVRIALMIGWGLVLALVINQKRSKNIIKQEAEL